MTVAAREHELIGSNEPPSPDQALARYRQLREIGKRHHHEALGLDLEERIVPPPFSSATDRYSNPVARLAVRAPTLLSCLCDPALCLLRQSHDPA